MQIGIKYFLWIVGKVNLNLPTNQILQYDFNDNIKYK